MRIIWRRTMAIAPSTINTLKFIDIGANLTDPVYRGCYHGKQAHEGSLRPHGRFDIQDFPPEFTAGEAEEKERDICFQWIPDGSNHLYDLHHVLNRARQYGVQKIIITGGSLKESKTAIQLAKSNDDLFCTVGCHPTRSLEFEKENPDSYLQKLIALANDNKDKVVAVGEMGLDFDRLHFSPKEAQIKYFEKQMDLISATNLPVFLHSRAAHKEFLSIISRYRDSIPGGVVHSFTGTKEEVADILEQGLYIGINGCSLKTQENLDVMCTVPSEKLMIETDCPYCEVRPAHAGHKFVSTKFESKRKEKFDPNCCVKSRNEPCTIMQVLEVMSGARGEDKQKLADIMYQNTLDLFFKGCDKTIA